MRSQLRNLTAIAAVLSILLVVPPALHAQAEDPWNYLQNFTLVDGAGRPLEDGYIGVVLHNSEEGLFALVIFAGGCRGQSCAVENPVAYFVVDTQNRLVKSHVEPGAKLETMLGGFLIS